MKTEEVRDEEHVDAGEEEETPHQRERADPRASGDWRETRREDHPAEEGRPPFLFVALDRASVRGRPVASAGTSHGKW